MQSNAHRYAHAHRQSSKYPHTHKSPTWTHIKKLVYILTYPARYSHADTFTCRGKPQGGPYLIVLSLTAQQMESEFALMTSAEAHQIKSFCLFVTHTRTVPQSPSVQWNTCAFVRLNVVLFFIQSSGNPGKIALTPQLQWWYDIHDVLRVTSDMFPLITDKRSKLNAGSMQTECIKLLIL